MSNARYYSVTPRTVCVRDADGKKSIMHFTRPKDDNGVWGFLRGGSFKDETGKWVRTYEHPQEWSEDF